MWAQQAVTDGMLSADADEFATRSRLGSHDLGVVAGVGIVTSNRVTSAALSISYINDPALNGLREDMPRRRYIYSPSEATHTYTHNCGTGWCAQNFMRWGLSPSRRVKRVDRYALRSALSAGSSAASRDFWLAT